MDTNPAERVELAGPEVTVVLPTYNERKNIFPMFERLKSALRDFRWEVVVVDDNSSDGTAEAVRAIGAIDRRVRCIRRVGRRGLSGACVEGALAAQAPIIVIMDADQQHDERIVPQMIELMRTNCYDLVVGTRYSMGGSLAGLHGYRRQTSRVGNDLARYLAGASVSDAMSGFFAIRREVVDVLAPEISPDGFKLLLDVLLTRRMNLKIGEVPYEFRSRQEGESKLGIRVALDFAALVLARLTRNILPQRFLLFCVVGLSGIAVHLGVLLVLRTLGFAFNGAQVMAALVAVASNFWLNNLLTYRGQALRGWQAVRGLLIFYLICAFGLISNISVAAWIVASTDTWPVAGGVGAIMSAVWNYVVSATFVWGTTVNAKAEKLGFRRSVPPLGANLRPEGAHAVLAQWSWWPLALLVIYITMRIALDAWWLWQFRDGYPLNTDEVGYLTYALDDTQGLKSGGIAGLWHAYLGSGPQAPLVPLLTVPIHLVFGEEIFPSFFVQTPFLVLLAFTSYGLAARLAGPSWGLLAALIVTSIPEMTDWARTFHFGVPAAALFTAATYALVRTEGFADRKWALAWGLLLGLTLLVRTMMIALVPGLVLAATLTVVFGPTERKRRAVNFGLALAVGFAIAATWYGRNWPIVAEYLLNFGYGDRSAYHGLGYPMLSWAYWTARLNTIINRGFYLPLAILVAATLIVGIAHVVLQTREIRRIGGALRLNLQNDVWICSIVVVSGYLALTSSRNDGTGFALPLLPILVALAMAAAARLRPQAVRACLVAAFLLVSLVNVVMKADVVPAFSGSWGVPVPALGGLRVIEGRGDIQRTLAYAGNDVGPPTARMPEVHKQWLVLGREVTTWLDRFADRHQRQPIVIFASKDPFFNTNLIGLSARLHLRRGLWVGQLEPTRGGDNTEAYRMQLTDPLRGPPNLVVTTDPGPTEYTPSVTQAHVEHVARSLGFRQVGSFHLPDGRETRVWWLDRGAAQ